MNLYLDISKVFFEIDYRLLSIFYGAYGYVMKFYILINQSVDDNNYKKNFYK